VTRRIRFFLFDSPDSIQFMKRTGIVMDHDVMMLRFFDDNEDGIMSSSSLDLGSRSFCTNLNIASCHHHRHRSTRKRHCYKTIIMKEQKEVEAMLDATVDDHVPTGTPDVLESPHVSEGPGKIANAPVPSVFVGLLRLGYESRSLMTMSMLIVCSFSFLFLFRLHREMTAEQLTDCG
jgi:hypothetical protein